MVFVYWFFLNLYSLLHPKTFHLGAQYPWSDALHTLKSCLNEKSVWTKDASVQMGFELDLKPPSLMWLESDLQKTDFLS